MIYIIVSCFLFREQFWLQLLVENLLVSVLIVVCQNINCNGKWLSKGLCRLWWDKTLHVKICTVCTKKLCINIIHITLMNCSYFCHLRTKNCSIFPDGILPNGDLHKNGFGPVSTQSRLSIWGIVLIACTLVLMKYDDQECFLFL